MFSERFGGKDPSVLNNANACFDSGYGHSLENLLKSYQFFTPEAKLGTQVVMNGNEAIAYGLIAAGVRFGAGYPITPWSDIMELLRKELPKYGGTFIQCEDEIASVSMALGASWGGRVAVTGSSGPGISLKTEAIGWASMAEMPLIVVDVQRGGPSTGMPTNVEQSDLNIATFSGISAIDAQPIASVFSEMPGPDDPVTATRPPQLAPSAMETEAISSSHWMKLPPYFGSSLRSNSIMSDHGVIG